MANDLERQITEEGPRNAVVKLTGYLDSTDAVEKPAIRLTDFTNNDPSGLVLTGFRIDLIEWSISNPVEVSLAWNGLNPQQIYLLSGRGRIDAHNYGGFVPNTLNQGYDGNINLTSANYQAGSIAMFTIILELIKLYSR